MNTPLSPWWKILPPLLFTATWIFLLTRAWRGRWVGSHPVCRRCGFDLRGLPRDTSQCSECGADVSQPKAVAVGERRRSTKVLATCSVMLLLSAGWLTLAAWSASGRLDAQRYKPAWLLLRETRGADVQTRDAALAELVRRFDAGALPDAALGELVRQALALQADKNKPWNTAWGEVVESAHAAGKVSDERWRQYLSNVAGPTLEVRPVVRRGDPIPYWLGWTPSRGGKRQISVQLNVSAVDFDDLVKLDRPGMSGQTMLEGSGRGGRSMGSSLKPTNEVLRQLEDGQHRLRVTFDLSVGTFDAPGAAAKKQVTVEAPVKLVPAGTETMTVVKDPSLRTAVQSVLTISNLTYDTHQPQFPRLNVTVNTAPPPVGLGYDVFVKAGDREWPAGRFARAAGGSGHGFGIGGDIKDFDAEMVDVVLRPSVDAALNTTETTEIWDGEIVIKDIKVERREK